MRGAEQIAARIMFARLHPLIVHLPIGCIVLAFVAGWLFRSTPRIVQTGWLLAFFSALLACITGYLLAQQSGGLEPDAVQTHQYLNIGITVLCAAQWWLAGRGIQQKWLTIASFVPFLGMLAGSYTGATLTHGDDFLTPSTLLQAHKDDGGTIPSTDLPSTEAPAPNTQALTLARQRGLVIMPVGENSNWLSVNAINAPNFSDADVVLLAPLAPNIVWLRLSDTRLTDTGLASLAAFNNLTRLYLDHCPIEGSGLTALAKMENLVLLSLSGTRVTAGALAQLPALPKLKRVFLYKTPVSGQPLAAKLGSAVLDTGGHVLPVLEGDTALLKAKPSY